MKKLLALLPASILAFSFACDDSGSSAVPCETDEDCAEGEACLPVTDVGEELSCQAAECVADQDCQVAYNATDDAASPSCEAADGCGEGEFCAAGFNGEGFCVAADPGAGACEDVGGEVVSLDTIDGASADACLDPAADRTCNAGACENQ